MKLDSMPRVELTALPTPLDEAPRLAQKIGLRRLLVKRDDCTTLAMGGNKARKLEFLMADALSKGANVVMTDGGPQSNHARMTAAACRKVGIDQCILFLGGPRFDRFHGNLLLDIILGAEIRYMEDATVKHMEKAMAEEADALRGAGRIPYIIPIGGSSPVGILGYVAAMRELAEQLSDEDKPPVIFVSVGSAGTIAGCVLGIRLFMPEARLIGISVSRKSKPLCETTALLATEAARLIDVRETFAPDDITVNDEYYGQRYAVPTEAGNNAIRWAARTEGLILDPVYTGKGLSGLIGMTRNEEFDTDRTVVFIHTGGAPGLMAYEDQFRNEAKLQIVSFEKEPEA